MQIGVYDAGEIYHEGAKTRRGEGIENSKARRLKDPEGD